MVPMATIAPAKALLGACMLLEREKEIIMNNLSQMKGFIKSVRKTSLVMSHMKLKSPMQIPRRRKMADERNFPFPIWDLNRL